MWRRIPDFVGFGTESIHFHIQVGPIENDPPAVLTWQIAVKDIGEAIERCSAAGVEFEIEQNDPALGWRYPRLLIETPSDYRLALEGRNE